MKAFQAYANKGSMLIRPTPRAAALAFFESNPSRRKCDVIEGEVDGHCFTVKYGRVSQGEWPQSWKGVTKKTAMELPE